MFKLTTAKDWHRRITDKDCLVAVDYATKCRESPELPSRFATQILSELKGVPRHIAKEALQKRCKSGLLKMEGKHVVRNSSKES